MGAHHVLEGYIEPPAAHGHACNGGLPGGVGAHRCDQVYVPQHYPAVEQDVKDALPGAAPVRFRLRMPAEYFFLSLSNMLKHAITWLHLLSKGASCHLASIKPTGSPVVNGAWAIWLLVRRASYR